MKTSNRHRGYWAFVGHRLSGLALAIFLPVHFYVLGMALEASRLDAFLKFSQMGAAKVGEWGLVLLLSLHMFFGLRLLVLELVPWRSTHDARLSWVAWGGAVSLGIGFIFIAGVI